MVQQFQSWEYIQKKLKHYFEKIHIPYPNVHCSIIYNSQDMETT